MEIKGFVEKIGTTQVRGWSFSPEQPNRHLEIAVFCDVNQIAEGSANLFREDLFQGGVGDGDHGFVINFQQGISEELLAKVRVVVLNDSAFPTELELLNLHQSETDKKQESIPVIASDGNLFTSQAPVFIMGAARSGTSALTQTLLRCGIFDGHEEGHFFALLPRLLFAVQQYYADNGDETARERNTFLSRVTKSAIDESVKDIFRSIARVRFPCERWLDKTPTSEMVIAAPLLRQLWPNSRFVFMKRSALDNIASRMRKFPQVSFADHCRDWAEVMNAWRQVRDLLGPTAIEIEQFEMAESPDQISARLVPFLKIPFDAARRFSDLLRVEQPERTSIDMMSTVSADELGWSKEEQKLLVALCGDEMRAYGYGMSGLNI